MKKIILLFLFLQVILTLNAQRTELGTEIWIEPGYSKENIMNWVRMTKDAGFKDVRIFMMWTHVESQLNKWDFDVYDWIFAACEQYDLRLQVTLNANQPAYHYGKEYWSSIHSHAIFSDENLRIAAGKYIKKVVERYKNSPALDNWWIMNEPYPMDDENPFILSGFRNEMKTKYARIEALNKAWNTDFKSFSEIRDVNKIFSAEWAAAMPYYDWKLYSNKHLTEFQRWVRDEVRKYDNKHNFHTNPGAYLTMYHRQDATAWKPFLNSLGLSIHPSWHFDIFTPDQYAMAVAATCELGRSAANPNPFWISELSGGNNMFRLCPSSNEIAQWTWIGIAQGAQKIIYWLLNARTSGNEAGEWALLDFQNNPTGRLRTTKNIADCLTADSSFFNNAQPANSNIIILLSPESSLTYDRKGRTDLHNMAAMGCYQSLTERGIAAQIRLTKDFQWSKSRGKAAIMANMITIPDVLTDSIKTFLNNGNKLIVLGPSGFYNEFEDCKLLNFPLKKEFGAEIQEFRSLTDRFQISSEDGKYNFAVNKILGIIKNNTAAPIFMTSSEITGIRNKTEKGEVVWVPSGIDLGAWLYDTGALSQFLSDELAHYYANQPFSFSGKTNNVMMQTMHHGSTYLTVITNGLNTANKVQLINRLNKSARIIFCTDPERKEVNVTGKFSLSPRECLVLIWE